MMGYIQTLEFWGVLLITIIGMLSYFFGRDIIMSVGICSVVVLWFAIEGWIPYWIGHLMMLFICLGFVRVIYAMVIPSERDKPTNGGEVE